VNHIHLFNLIRQKNHTFVMVTVSFLRWETLQSNKSDV